MSKLIRLIFLDIDGPMIPSGMFLIDRDASYKRVYSPIAVGVINHLCHETKAKIVFNTTHNMFDNPFTNKSVIEDSIDQGIKRGHLFNNGSKTKYPDIPRLDAIKLWLKEHEMTEENAVWIAFDDVDFKHDNLILVDYDVGLTPQHLNEGIKKLGKGREFLVL